MLKGLVTNSDKTPMEGMYSGYVTSPQETPDVTGNEPKMVEPGYHVNTTNEVGKWTIQGISGLDASPTATYIGSPLEIDKQDPLYTGDGESPSNDDEWMFQVGPKPLIPGTAPEWDNMTLDEKLNIIKETVRLVWPWIAKMREINLVMRHHFHGPDGTVGLDLDWAKLMNKKMKDEKCPI